MTDKLPPALPPWQRHLEMNEKVANNLCNTIRGIEGVS